MTTLITPMIETIIKSSVILGFTFFVTLALRRQSAALRHTVWTMGLLCSLGLPLFNLVLPAWHVAPTDAVQPSLSVIVSHPAAAESGETVVSSPAVVPSTQSTLSPGRMLLLTWLIGILSVASLLLREAVRLARVAFGSTTVQQTSWRELVRDVSHALALTRRVRLMRNPNASVLGTWGTLRPRVLLPRESESWSDERMRVVLGHELAHVKRNDWLIQIIAETARAIYWFNPLFWIACRELRRESEHACDDAAMNLGGPLGMDGPTYAGHVLDLARSLKHSGQPAAAALAMANPSNLERRLIAMLNPSLNRSITGKRAAVIIALLALGVTLPLAAVSSQAPLPAVSVTPAMEFVSPAPTMASQAAAASLRESPRALPRTAAVMTGVSPVVEPGPAPTPQNVTATLSGTISDQTGAVIPGVSVKLTANSTGVVRSTVADGNGSFTFTELTPDKYSATADLPGFKRASFSYLVVEPGSARLNITLSLAELWTVINITVQAPPGLKCISMFGSTKSDGTPFTAADCPGGTILVAPVKTSPPALADAERARELAARAPSPETITVNSQPTITATAQGPTRVGGVIQNGRLIFHPSPAYPAEARSRGIEGVVTVSGVVGKDGQLRSLKIVGSSSSLLETTALETLQSWKYEPTLLNGEPAEVITVITLNYMFAG